MILVLRIWRRIEHCRFVLGCFAHVYGQLCFLLHTLYIDDSDTNCMALRMKHDRRSMKVEI